MKTSFAWEWALMAAAIGFTIGAGFSTDSPVLFFSCTALAFASIIASIHVGFTRG